MIGKEATIFYIYGNTRCADFRGTLNSLNNATFWMTDEIGAHYWYVNITKIADCIIEIIPADSDISPNSTFLWRNKADGPTLP